MVLCVFWCCELLLWWRKRVSCASSKISRARVKSSIGKMVFVKLLLKREC